MTTTVTRRTDYAALIVKVSTELGLDPDLVEAITIKETRKVINGVSYLSRADAFRFEEGFYNRYLKGKPEWKGKIPRRIASSYGLMQVMYTTAFQFGFRGEPELLFVPENSLFWGGKYLRYLLQWSGGHEHKACAAYNGGQGNWQAPIPQAYADEILSLCADLRSAA